MNIHTTQFPITSRTGSLSELGLSNWTNPLISLSSSRNTCHLQLWLVFTCAAQCSLLVPRNFQNSSGQDPSLFSSRLLSQAPLPHPIPPIVIAARKFELWRECECLDPGWEGWGADGIVGWKPGHQGSPPSPAKDATCDQANGLAAVLGLCLLFL